MLANQEIDIGTIHRAYSDFAIFIRIPVYVCVRLHVYIVLCNMCRLLLPPPQSEYRTITLAQNSLELSL